MRKAETMLEALVKLNPFAEPLLRQQVRESHMNFVRHAGEWAWRNLATFYQSAKPAVPFSEMYVGREATLEMRTYWWSTWYFACCTGDFNRVHFDPDGVAPFEGPICHGMHIASVFSKILGTEFPGPGTIFGGIHSLTWKGPVYIGESVDGTVCVTKLEPKRKPNGLNRITFDGKVHNKAGKLVLEAELIGFVQ